MYDAYRDDESLDEIVQGEMLVAMRDGAHARCRAMYCEHFFKRPHNDHFGGLIACHVLRVDRFL